MAGTIVVDRIESDSSYASTINVASRVNFAGGYQVGGYDGAGMRNRIINGDMRVSQRYGTSAVAVSAATDGIYPIDRWQARFWPGGSANVNFEQSSTAPTGFNTSLKITVTTANTPVSGSYNSFKQQIEGYNIDDLDWGTSNAKPVTISFWVRSSLVGVYGFRLMNGPAGKAIFNTYTISQADTWEKKTITFAGPTDGTWYFDNRSGVHVQWCLNSGSTFKASPSLTNIWSANDYHSSTDQANWTGTLGNTFYITGVQFEKGNVATDFEKRNFGLELAMCQRYAFMQTSATAGGSYMKYANAICVSTTGVRATVHFPATMRVYPSLSTTTTASNYGVWNVPNGDQACSAVPVLNSNSGTTTGTSEWTVASGLTAGQAAVAQSNANQSSFLFWSAEL